MILRLRTPTEAAPKRLAAISKLPVFYNLDGRRVAVAGGTAAAAWKAELLAAAGAHVDIYAEVLTSEMAELLEHGGSAGRLNHIARRWDVTCFTGSVMAVADAADAAEAQAFYCSAMAAGVPANVIDKPAYGMFQFGSIVNRFPLIIGISTDGAAPVLGQAIRRRIETLLPAHLGEWAGLAKTIRAQVSKSLSFGPQRRALWERLADVAFTRPVGKGDQEDLLSFAASIAQGAADDAGKVTLVGAGPGDPDMLTLKAVRALQSADVILFDDLISDGVLELARREAKRMMVGKRGGRASCRQEDINDLMVKLARQGKHVVRLKAGDPMVFGRAGEEISRLDSEGIAVDVVPGITAASALASTLGLSLTHRDLAHSVRLVTGHSRAGQLSEELDWRGLADPETTLVFYMAGRTAAAIASRLMAEGLPGATPVRVAISVTRPAMEVISTTLEGLRSLKLSDDVDGPVLIAIGRCFGDRREVGFGQYGEAEARVASQP